MMMVVNNSFPEVNHIAAGLAEVGLLSTYVRPYANLQRYWERYLSNSGRLGDIYNRSLGRRYMPTPLSSSHIHEAGVLTDFLAAAYSRLPSSTFKYQAVRKSLLRMRTNSIVRKSAEIFTSENAVVASWGCAELVFRKAKSGGALCVLNYSIAHHRFARRYLDEEARNNPTFASTLNSHKYPKEFERRLDMEIELADRILVGSGFVRDSFIAEGVPSDKLVVIPYGADTSLFQPRSEDSNCDGPLRLLFVGQIGQRKGISYLLESIQRVHSEGDILTLVGQFQGNGQAISPYRHSFRHIPHVPRNELNKIYQHADVFVFPTLIEGMPLVVLEAMACGLPVITTPNGPGDIVRDGLDGYLVPPRDVNAIVDRLGRLRADPSLRKKMGHNARQRALSFTWDVYKNKVIDNLLEWTTSDDAKRFY